MDFFVGATIILTIWGAMGPLVGIVLGHRLRKSWQREQWIADNRRREYQELLGTLMRSAGILMDYRNAMGTITAGTAEDQRRRAEAGSEAANVLSDRIFIANDIQEARIPELWSEMTTDYMTKGSLKQFDDRLEHIRKVILAAATKHP